MSLITPDGIDWIHKTLNSIWLLDINPEFSHKVAMILWNKMEGRWNKIRQKIEEILYLEDRCLETRIGNMTFKNPVWLAAGLAKQSDWLWLLEAFWFWSITIGGITHDAQPGNLKPRIFKFPRISSMVNGMWLPGDGVAMEVKRLEMRKQLWLMPKVPLIANLCNGVKSLTEEDKIAEFKLLMEKLYPYMDWFEINVSCPNQKWVCDMQQEGKIKNLLTQLLEHNKSLATKQSIERKTMLVKIAPLTKYEHTPEKIKDLTLSSLKLMVNVFNEVKIDGVTATNTSQEHELETEIKKPDGSVIQWWLSGLGLNHRSLDTARMVRSILDKDIPIIGVWWIGYDKWRSWVEMLRGWGTQSIGILSSFVQKSVVAPYYLKREMLEYKHSEFDKKRFLSFSKITWK